ncbi:MAG: efflux RND transporter periplasmic adaptor subunit [Phycisphaerales bacterium]
MSPQPISAAPPSPPVSVTWWQRRARRVWMIARVGGALAVIVAGVWWMLLAPVAVTTHTVTRGDVTAEVLGTGTLEARVSAIIGPKIPGLIVKIAADQGDRVRAGQTLVFLEDSDFTQQVGVAEADLAAARAGLDRLVAEQGRAAAVLAQARLTHQRVSEAWSKNATSAQEVDTSAEALAVAEAEGARARAAIVEGERRLTAAERSLEYQRTRLHDTTIEAPFDGLVVRRDRDPGDVVTAGSSVLQLVSLDEMWITAWVDETELARLAEGQPARVVFRSEPGVEYAGAVSRVGREADRETREIVVDVRVEALPGNWAVGQRAEAYVRVDRKVGVVTLPAALVLVRDGKAGVMVDDGGIARWREIAVGLRGRGAVEVTSGLSPGDVVVSPASPTAGALRSGRRIAPK